MIQDVNQQELNQALEVYEAMGDERDKWRIRDDEGANKYMRIVRSLEGQMADVEKMRKAEVERIDAFYQGQREEIDGKAEFFRQLLVDYYQRKRELDPKYQLKTPWGRVTSRRVKTMDWRDEAQTLAWLEDSGHSDLVKVEKSIKKADLKKAMNAADGHFIDPATGEIVPGVAFEEKVNVSVKVEV